MSEKAIVLVIEDHPSSRMLLVDLLEMFGYEVHEASNGEEGLDQARRYKPDLILTDMGMPGMSGWEMVPIIKSDDDLRHIPVVAITAFAMTGDRERAIELGCDGYISKPIETRLIREQIAGFLTEAESKQPVTRPEQVPGCTRRSC